VISLLGIGGPIALTVEPGPDGHPSETRLRTIATTERAVSKVLDTAIKLTGKVDEIDPLLRQATGGEQF
jgi:hypothetical protein